MIFSSSFSPLPRIRFRFSPLYFLVMFVSCVRAVFFSLSLSQSAMQALALGKRFFFLSSSSSFFKRHYRLAWRLFSHHTHGKVQ